MSFAHRLRGLAAPLALIVVLLLGLAQAALAREIVDTTGRTVTVPDAPARVFAARPPAAVPLWALKPEAIVG